MRHVADNRRARRTPAARLACVPALAGCLAVLLTLAPSVVDAASTRSVAARTSKQVKSTVKRAQSVSAPRLRVVDLACVASFQFDFSPKLNFNTVSSQTTAALTGCVSPNSSHPNLLSAVLFADRGHSTASGCSPFPIIIDGVGSILWNDATSSEFTFRVNTNPVAPGFGLTANITSGTLGGARISGVPFVVAQDGLCGLGGVNSLSVNLGTDIVTQ